MLQLFCLKSIAASIHRTIHNPSAMLNLYKNQLHLKPNCAPGISDNFESSSSRTPRHALGRPCLDVARPISLKSFLLWGSRSQGIQPCLLYILLWNHVLTKECRGCKLADWWKKEAWSEDHKTAIHACTERLWKALTLIQVQTQIRSVID